VAGIVKKLNRNVVPRWRTLADSIEKHELGFPREAPRRSEDFLSDKKQAWEQNRTIWHASDLVGAAVSLRRSSEVKDAAEFLVGSSDAPATARRVANRIIGSEAPGALEPAAITVPADIRAEIRRRRRSLRDDPRNAIQWIELARDYTIAGFRPQAERAITAALSINRQNRFILRSASRFYLHDDQPDRAHYILRTAPNSKDDPWLIAAEIAVASTAGGPSRLVDFGRKMLVKGNHLPFQTTELASALATLELANGKTRSARDLFRLSLIKPTENSLAQAEWALDQVRGLQLDVERYPEVAGKFEAAAWEYFNKGSWELSLANSRAWFSDQAFSSRPAMLASYVSMCIFEDYHQGILILEDSLKANPGNPLLLNNLAFGLAMLGKADAAAESLRRIDMSKLSKFDKAVITATRGLVAYRQHDIDLGRKHYLEALEIAKELEDRKFQAEALFYFAQEEIRARAADAPETFSRTLNVLEAFDDPKMRRLTELLKDKAKRVVTIATH
jgi:tetratricopeptide (TPR) repeat protein